MASPPFRVQIVHDEIGPGLAAVAAKLGNLTPLMRGIAGVLEDEAQQAFETESDPTAGAPWAEYLHADEADEYPDAYIHRPRAQGGRGGERRPKLQMSGDLAKLWTDAGPTYAVIGSGEVYSAIHQFGGTADMPAGPAAVPARPYLGLSDAGAGEILDLIGRYLQP